MMLRDGSDGDNRTANTNGVQAWTAFREAEKKYALHREQKMRMKGGKLRAGPVVTRPLDLSQVLDLHADQPQPGVTRHVVPGCAGPAFTFEAHPGLVFLAAAVPPQQQRALLRAALHDYPQPPARTNHTAHYGPITGLWQAAQAGAAAVQAAGEGAQARAGAVGVGARAGPATAAAQGGGGRGPLRLRWVRLDEPTAGPPRRLGCEHPSATPRTCGAAAHPQWRQQHPAPLQLQHQQHHHHQQQQQDLALQQQPHQLHDMPAGVHAGRAAAGQCDHPSHHQPDRLHRQQQPNQQQLQRRPSDDQGRAELCAGSRRCPGHQRVMGPDGEARGGGGGSGEHGASSSGRSSCDGSHCSSASEALLDDFDDGASEVGGVGPPGGDSVAGEAGGGGRSRGAPVPSFAECWSVQGPGPTAEQMLRKLRWATLGPQFDWTLRQYDMAAEHRPLPASLAQLATQLAAAVEALQLAGLGVLPAGASGRAAPYRPDAAIVNYYQPGDALGGHLDDVERDLAQPIVSASLGAPAIFLMGGPSRAQRPTAVRLRGGDVLVLAGAARRCYHGVPRILEPDDVADAQADLAGTDGVGRSSGSGSRSPEEAYFRTARVNISIRAVR